MLPKSGPPAGADEEGDAAPGDERARAGERRHALPAEEDDDQHRDERRDRVQEGRGEAARRGEPERVEPLVHADAGQGEDEREAARAGRRHEALPPDERLGDEKRRGEDDPPSRERQRGKLAIDDLRGGVVHRPDDDGRERAEDGEGSSQGRRHGLTLPRGLLYSHGFCGPPAAPGRGQTRRSPRRDARSTGTFKVVLRNAGGHGRELPGRERRDSRLSRPERGRQDDHDADDHGLSRADGRPRHARGRGRHGKAAPGQALARVPARDARALSGDAGQGVRRLPRRAVRGAGTRREGVRRRGAREVLRGRRRVESDRQPLEGIPPARRPRGGARPQAEGARPRRAHGRAGPAADREGARADPRPAERTTRSCCRPTSSPRPSSSATGSSSSTRDASWRPGRRRRFATRCRRCPA